MRSFLLFIGSLLYPAVMLTISPVLAFLYVLLAVVWTYRFLRAKTVALGAWAHTLRMPALHVSSKRSWAVWPKALRLH